MKTYVVAPVFFLWVTNLTVYHTVVVFRIEQRSVVSAQPIRIVGYSVSITTVGFLD